MERREFLWIFYFAQIRVIKKGAYRVAYQYER